MGTILYDLYTSGSYPVVASIALVMTFVTAVGVLIAIILGGSQVFDKL
jgi:iron(III) transport system permease protein